MDNLFEQMASASKAYGYDILAKQVGELKEGKKNKFSDQQSKDTITLKKNHPMNIIDTCNTIEKWINSCETIEQLELADEAVSTFLQTHRFKDEVITYFEMEAHKSILREKIEYSTQRLLFVTK